MEETKPTEELKVTVTNMYEVFSHELGDVYDAEHRLLEDRGQRAQSASGQKLSEALQEDQDRARGRIQNIEKAFERLGEEPERQTCQATQGLISEAQAGIGEAESGPVRDLLINAATIKEELYKAAAYRNLINSVQSLEGESEDAPLEGRDEIASSLEENLRQSEQAARDAEQEVPALSDAAKKAGAFRRARQTGEQDKGLVDKAKDKLSGQ
jgi:ferritin-like metal-binding protein YciE